MENIEGTKTIQLISFFGSYIVGFLILNGIYSIYTSDKKQNIKIIQFCCTTLLVGLVFPFTYWLSWLLEYRDGHFGWLPIVDTFARLMITGGILFTFIIEFVPHFAERALENRLLKMNRKANGVKEEKNTPIKRQPSTTRMSEDKTNLKLLPKAKITDRNKIREPITYLTAAVITLALEYLILRLSNNSSLFFNLPLLLWVANAHFVGFISADHIYYKKQPSSHPEDSNSRKNIAICITAFLITLSQTKSPWKFNEQTFDHDVLLLLLISAPFALLYIYKTTHDNRAFTGPFMFDEYKKDKEPGYEVPENGIHFTQDYIHKKLDSKFPIDSPNEDGLTPLMFAIKHSSMEENYGIKSLLFQGANPNISIRSKTPLTIAIESNRSWIVKELLSYGADPIAFNSLNLACYSHSNPKIIQHLISAGADLNTTHSSRVLPFHSAIVNRNKNTIQFLNELKSLGAVFNTDHYWYPESPLHTICSKDTYSFIGGIINKHGIENDLNLIEYLVNEGLSPNKLNLSGLTPTDVALQSGSTRTLKIIKKLIELGADPTNCLIHACQNRNENYDEIIEHLVRCDVDITLELDDSGNTALHLVQTEKSYDLLVRHGANDDKLNKSDETPLLLAAKKFGIFSGPFGEIKNLKDKKNSYKHSGILLHSLVKKIDLNKEILQRLTHLCVDLEYKDKNGNTALHLSANHDENKNLLLLLNHGLNPNIVNNDGRNALMKLCDTYHEPDLVAIRAVLEKGVDWKTPCWRGRNLVDVLKNIKNDYNNKKRNRNNMILDLFKEFES